MTGDSLEHGSGSGNNSSGDRAVDDAALIRFVGSAFDDGRGGHETQHVLARGRQLRRRRHAMPALGALGGVAAVAGLAVALAGPGRGAGPAMNVDNAAFSVHTDARSGKITVTVRQFSDENELKQILEKAGVRTVFAAQQLSRTTTSCTWPGPATLPLDGVVQSWSGPGEDKSRSSETIVIDPAKMPAGAVLALDYVMVGDGKTIITTTLLSGEPTGCGA